MPSKIQIPGIVFDPNNYSQQLTEKSQGVCDLLSPFQTPAPFIAPSPPNHFRMRAEFRIWHERPEGEENNHRCFYAMFNPEEPKKAIEVEHFPIVNLRITELMQPLIKVINQNFVLNRKLFQIEFLSTLSNECLVTLVYHRQLDEDWIALAQQLEQQFNILVIGRARKQKVVISKDYVTESLKIHTRQFYYQQKENSFTQPNAFINQQMIEWTCNFFSSNKAYKPTDLLELYCGNGNFTLPLSQYFNQVLATEISKVSIKSAQTNCQLNQIDNIQFIRLSGEETASALNREREFRRLKHISLDSYNFSTVFVDPPRAGLDQQTINIVQQYKTIIYISCNPETLANNLSQLTKTHKIERFAIFDQFPYTPHCECGVILKQR